MRSPAIVHGEKKRNTKSLEKFQSKRKRPWNPRTDWLPSTLISRLSRILFFYFSLIRIKKSCWSSRYITERENELSLYRAMSRLTTRGSSSFFFKFSFYNLTWIHINVNTGYRKVLVVVHKTKFYARGEIFFFFFVLRGHPDRQSIEGRMKVITVGTQRNFFFFFLEPLVFLLTGNKLENLSFFLSPSGMYRDSTTHLEMKKKTNSLGNIPQCAVIWITRPYDIQ